jgi:Uma2 family endonuclease
MYNATVAVRYEEELPTSKSALGPYREGDYWRLPDDPRCELLYGWLVLTPAPSLRHQRVLAALNDLLRRFAAEHGGEALFSPLDVRLADHSIVQPDLIYVSPARRDVLRERVHGAPDLVVEALSPSTARRDLGPKLRLYAESGVAEYWIVDPANGTFEFLVADAGSFRVALPVDGVYRSPAVEGLAIDLEAVWRGIPE